MSYEYITATDQSTFFLVWLYTQIIHNLSLLIYMRCTDSYTMYKTLSDPPFHSVQKSTTDNNEQDRRWNADKPLAALDPYIPTWLTTSPANHRPANFWKSFFFWKHWRKLWKVVQSQIQLMRINFKYEAPILWFFKYKLSPTLSISLQWEC